MNMTTTTSTGSLTPMEPAPSQTWRLPVTVALFCIGLTIGRNTGWLESNEAWVRIVRIAAAGVGGGAGMLLVGWAHGALAGGWRRLLARGLPLGIGLTVYCDVKSALQPELGAPWIYIVASAVAAMVAGLVELFADRLLRARGAQKQPKLLSI
jgi:hypothetical protein